MSPRVAIWLAWGLWALYVGLFGFGSLVVLLVTGTADDVLVPIIASLPLLTVGALIAARRPQNPIGWLFLAMLFALAVQAVAASYGHRSPPPPGAAWARWLEGVLFILVGSGMFPLLLLIFPTGRLPSHRWRSVAWAIVILVAVLTAGHALAAVSEPVARVFDHPVVQVAGVVLVATVAVLAPLTALMLRLWQARGAERQQLKWFAYTAFLAVAGFVSGAIIGGNLGWTLYVVSAMFALVGLPVAIAIAIFRYRLYEIDRIINRTLVYGLLTISLGLVYAGGVLLLQRLFAPFTGGADLAIAASTLAVAALFRPARNRVQATVNRRFYRRRYDASRTLDAFSARLRQEVDLDSLSAELLAVVRETMQPAHVSLWLRSPISARTPGGRLP